MKFFSLQITTLLLLFASCNRQQEEPKELLIYCGTTMTKPMTEIASKIEKEEHCKIYVLKGGSGDLLNSIIANKQGDLFLPGSESYIWEAIKEQIITDTVTVGENRAVLMIRKGEKDKIERSDLCFLQDNKLKIAIANPFASSIGKESRKILEKKNIYNDVISRISFFGTDSKDLSLAIKEGRADVAINWYAPVLWKENKDFVEVVEIDSKFRNNKKLILSVLTYSKHPKIAKKVLEYAQTNEGKKIFAKYGFKKMD